MRQGRRVIAGLALLACATLAAQQSRSSWSGVYTAEQAAAGEKIYFEKCASCHGADLAGDRARSCARRRRRSSNRWHGRDLRRLLERIDTMPPAAPKSLSAAESVAVLAFLLRAAEMPGGPTALPTDRAQLAADHVRTGAGGRRRERARRCPHDARTSPPRRPSPAPASGTRRSAWPTYGGNLASHRYSPADQITKDNFSKLEIAWRLKTDFLGPRPDTLYSATPLLVDRVLYTTAGMRRAVIALNADHRRNAVDAQRGRRAARPERDSHRRRPRASPTGRAPMAPIGASSTSRPDTG